MISELDDKEILDFLMTSDLEEDYSPSEFKYLIIKWRYFYRVIKGNYDRDRIDFEGKIKYLEETIGGKETEKILLQVDIAKKQNIIDQLRSRNLTWRERFSGKIILKEDENNKDM